LAGDEKAGAMNLTSSLKAATARLAAVSDTPRLDAELLLAHALGIPRDGLILADPESGVPAAFETLLARRECGEPIAYITGTRGFWTVELEVGPGVLIPRPDSESLIEAALDHFGTDGPRTVLDLGTGPGTLLLAALDQWPAARGLGVDASATALGYARRNAELLGVADRAEFRLGDWTEGLDARFELILCNPPYVGIDAELGPGVREWEPHEALFAGADGLDEYRRLASLIPPCMAPAGIACIEIGAGQDALVAQLFEAVGLRASRRRDLAGRYRCVTLSH
jgi:release factor glutamine methyltransferase